VNLSLLNYRNRFVFNWSKSGILRCESVYKAKLSDTLHVSYQAPKDPHPWTALIMSIALGKLKCCGTCSLLIHVTNSTLKSCRQDKSWDYKALWKSHPI
jgi:hypothetical protein